MYEDIPVETSGRDCPPAITSFEECNLPPALIDNIKRCRFTKPTPVQRYALPIGIAGRDLMACAQVRMRSRPGCLLGMAVAVGASAASVASAGAGSGGYSAAEELELAGPAGISRERCCAEAAGDYQPC